VESRLWKLSLGNETRLAVTDETMDDDNNCLPCLMEALKRGYAPKRIAVRTETQATVTHMEQLTSALRESCALTELCLLDRSGRERFQSLISIAEASGSLKTLEVDFTPRSPEEWERIWSVAASHPSLSTLRVRYCISYLSQRSNSGFDLLQAVETAARSNNRLMLIDVADESQKYHQTKEFKDRILPILRTNRIVNLTNAIKKSTDPDWIGRLFGVAVHRLGKSNNNKKGVPASALSCLFSLFRGNPECLERCTRVPDALRRLWLSRMRIVNALLGEVSDVEHRMVSSGVETPSATASAASLPNVTSWIHASARGCRPSQH
jgi:hypothetical protein